MNLILQAIKSLLKNVSRKADTALEKANTALESRTHWEDIESTPVLTDSAVSIASTNGYKSLANRPLLTIGETYDIVINGSTYRRIARAYGSYAVLGNGSFSAFGDKINENNDTFFICAYQGETLFYAMNPGTYNISIYHNESVVHKIDPKYLPDEHINSLIDTAIDNLEIPVGGGGGEWRKVAEIKTTEDLTYLSVTEDMDGNPFAFDEMIVLVGAARASDATTNGTLVISPCAEWRSSFNGHGVYGFHLNADVYAYPVAFRVLTDGLLRMDVSTAHRIANNLSQYAGYASNAEKGKAYYKTDFDYSGFTITPSKGLTDANSYLDENGRLRSVTIGTDMATSIKIGAGSTLEVWGR